MPTTNDRARPARQHTLATAATTTITRYGLGLLALATTALYAALILTACGSSTEAADQTHADTASASSSEPQITSEAVELSTSETLVPAIAAVATDPEPPTTELQADAAQPEADEEQTSSTDAPADLVATVDDLLWTLDENPFQADWSDEEKEQWRRSLYILTRFEVINAFMTTDQLEGDEVIAAVGPLPGSDAPVEIQQQFLVDIYNHADEIEIRSADGQPPRALGHWFRKIDILAQSTYDQMSRYAK
ncbi:MAG: hypothetical protein OEW83_05825 [Acidimicrobiia bacterium]|nr:hypothetical protein [Acidimicrobiia bacterium]